MTNAEQIALCWKQVEAIEEERVVLCDKAEAIRAKIRAMQPPMSDKDRTCFAHIAEEMFGPESPLLEAIIAGRAKLGPPLILRLPDSYGTHMKENI